MLGRDERKSGERFDFRQHLVPARASGGRRDHRIARCAGDNFVPWFAEDEIDERETRGVERLEYAWSMQTLEARLRGCQDSQRHS